MISKRQVHEFEPVYNKESEILILGTFPSVKSREEGFYYGHKQNRFWKVIAGVYGCELPLTIPDKKKMLLKHNIAIWDVIKSCDITGSSDSSIKNVVINDLSEVLDKCSIRAIYANGAKAKSLYDKYAKETYQREIIGLPSTSPANAAFSLEKLIQIYKEELNKGMTGEKVKWQSKE